MVRYGGGNFTPQWPPRQGSNQSAQNRAQAQEEENDSQREQGQNPADAQRAREVAAARRRARVLEGQEGYRAGEQQQQEEQDSPPPDVNIARNIAGQQARQQQAARRPQDVQEQQPRSRVVEDDTNNPGLRQRRRDLDNVDRAGNVDEIQEQIEQFEEIAPEEYQAQSLFEPRLLAGNVARSRYSQYRDLADVPGRRLLYANQLRSSTKLDPILKYYMTRDFAPLSFQDPDNASKNDFHFRHGSIQLPNQNGQRPLSFEPEGSINVHWSHGGFGYPQAVSDQNGRLIKGPLMPMAIGATSAGKLREDWIKATENTEASSVKGFTNVFFTADTSFVPILPDDGTNSDGFYMDYNFASDISSFAQSLMIPRLPDEQEREILADVPYNDDRVVRQLAAVGVNKQYFEQNWWRSVDGQPNPSTALSVQQTIDEKFNPLDPRRTRAALEVYPDDVFRDQSEGQKAEFEYYNFRTEAPYTVDYISAKSGLLDPNLTRPDGVMELGTIRSEFNTWQKAYMDAINNPAIPESVLPNLYIYDIVSSTPIPAYQGESWEGSPEAGETLQNNYDELVTMNDFESNLIPSLSSDGLQEYLQRYAQAVSGSSLAVDFIADIANRSNVLAVAGSDFDIFAEANRKKSFFPLYIEFELPTSGKTEISKLFETTYTTTSMIASINQTAFEEVPMNFQSSGIRCDGTDENPFSIDNAPVANFTKAFLNKNAKVYNFSDFMAGLNPLEGSVILTRRGNEPFDGVNMEDFSPSDATSAITNYVDNRCEELKINYKELLTLQHTNLAGFDPITSRTSYYCENETLMYKVEKYKYFSETSRTLLQTFYFPNSSFSNVIKYVDTQVKLNTLYEYEVTAYDLVYGSKFIFRDRGFNTGQSFSEIGDYNSESQIYFSFNVETQANPKIVEYPLLAKKWRYAPSKISRGDQQVITKESLNGSLSFPPISVLDRPPLPPGVSILPYNKNATEVLFNFQISIGEYTGENAVPFYGLTVEEEAVMDNISRKQKVRPLVSPTLRQGHLEFETNNSEEIRKIEVFRIKNMEIDTQNLRELYKKFDGNLHKVLDISDFGDEEFGKAKAFDFVDKLETNEKYYYIFRAYDASGLFSNPSMIHTVELRNDFGVYTPIIKIYEPKPVEKRSPKRRMARFIKISPSDLQKEPIVQEVGEDGSMQQTIGVVTETSDRVESNNFIVRLTSVDTGRKIDLRLNFKQKITTNEVLPDTSGNGRRQK